jgi:hypothetical protein
MINNINLNAEQLLSKITSVSPIDFPSYSFQNLTAENLVGIDLDFLLFKGSMEDLMNPEISLLKGFNGFCNRKLFIKNVYSQGIKALGTKTLIYRDFRYFRKPLRYWRRMH